MNKWMEYQKLTTIAKKFGGPINLICIISATSFWMGRKSKEIDLTGIKKTIKEHSFQLEPFFNSFLMYMI